MRTFRNGVLLLVAVCVLFAAVSLVVVPVDLGLGWDELVYVSQWGTHAPPAYLTPPRARGTMLLVGPIASWTDSIALLRGYLTVVAAVALGLAFLPWARVLPRPVLAPVAAALYGSLWITLFYADAAMPNHYVAMAAVGAVGCFLLGAARPDTRAPLVGLAAAVAVAALFRPPDAFWLALPLLVAAVAVPAPRRRRLAVAVLAGLALGGVPWVVEAELSYGGLRNRLADSSAAQGGTALTFSLDKAAATLDGPIICRPCEQSPWWPAVLWWLALGVVVPVGIRAAHRARAAWTAWLAVAVGASMAFTYLFLIDYSAPRFLLASYALLAVPAGWGLHALVTARGRAWRAVLVPVVAAGVAGHLVIQGAILVRVVENQVRARAYLELIAQTLHYHGVRPPCVVTGTSSVPVAFYAGCRNYLYRPRATEAQMRRAAGGERMALVLRGTPRPPWASGWVSVDVPELAPSGWRIYLPPP